MASTRPTECQSDKGFVRKRDKEKIERGTERDRERERDRRREREREREEANM